MPASLSFLVAAAALAGLANLALAQTNITASSCAASSDYSDCNLKVADKWRSCVNGCNGDGNCVVDCGCTAHQEYINCMAQTCWNQVYSCEYQLFVQQYFAICPSAAEPIPFWPAPENAPASCSCNLGKVLQATLGSRTDQINCMKKVTDSTTADLPNLANLSDGLDIAKQASECACCGASGSISAAWQVCPHTVPTLAGADLWPVFFPSSLPNLYTSIPNWAWSSCDGTLGSANCKDMGFADPSDTFYKPGSLPANGTSTLRNGAGTVTAPPSGTVLTWSQASSTYTVTATGYGDKAVAHGTGTGTGMGTGTGTGAWATATETAAGSGAGAVRLGSPGALVAVVAVAGWMAW